MPKYIIRITHEFEFDTAKYHDAEEGPPPTQNFDPHDKDSVLDYIWENVGVEVFGEVGTPDSVEIVRMGFLWP